MRIFRNEYQHPTQASRVGLSVFETKEGFLVAEDRSGPSTVYATLGVFGNRDEALARAEGRGEELQRQRYQLIAATAA
jgi:hypothetical protein